LNTYPGRQILNSASVCDDVVLETVVGTSVVVVVGCDNDDSDTLRLSSSLATLEPFSVVVVVEDADDVAFVVVVVVVDFVVVAMDCDVVDDAEALEALINVLRWLSSTVDFFLPPSSE